VLDPDKSLSHTVARVIAWLSESGGVSSDTGAYSKAVNDALSVIQRLLAQTAQTLSVQISDEQRWCGRRVCAYDGTTVTLCDTPANQQVYPQHGNQKQGCGFPLAKLVVLFCVTTGAVLEVSIAAFKVSECPALRPSPTGGCGCGRFCLRHLRGLGIEAAKADAVFRKHHARHCDFRRGKS